MRLEDALNAVLRRVHYAAAAGLALHIIGQAGGAMRADVLCRRLVECGAADKDLTPEALNLSPDQVFRAPPC